MNQAKNEAKRGGERDDMGPISFSVLPYEESHRGSRVEVVVDQSNQPQSHDTIYQQIL